MTQDQSRQDVDQSDSPVNEAREEKAPTHEESKAETTKDAETDALIEDRFEATDN